MIKTSTTPAMSTPARSSDRDVTRDGVQRRRRHCHLVSFMSHAADAQRAMSAATAVKTITVRAII
jgi:hypothetical protein